jgi:putative CocE/NonD family hydrolase
VPCLSAAGAIPKVHQVTDADSLQELENVFIPLQDGTCLAARLWLPARALADPAPAIFEYLPYRKRDLMRTRDESIHRYYAAQGYAAARVDVRGTGDSGGVLSDEYTEQEHDDALEVIAWLAEQPWCNGRVGMTGISWGGFNALQVAARRPPALGAIVTLCASDDRYADDAHYMGGCLLNENQIWGTSLFTLNALPPDPEVVGERWREMWQQRLQGDRPFPAQWLEHPHRDDYWRHGSVCEDYALINCPVYAIGGWADGYSNAVPRLMQGLTCTRKGLIGPWAHTFPHNGVPGPPIGFLQEAVRWWDRWLKGYDNGIEHEPLLRVWMQHSAVPEPANTDRAGHWVSEHSWPCTAIGQRQFSLQPIPGNTGGTLVAGGPTPGAQEIAPLTWRSAHSTGVSAAVWCEFGADGEAARDQRHDDGGSLVFDSPPLAAPFEILGAPEVQLRLAVDEPVAQIGVRLNEVFPDGTSARVTYSVLNLCHRTGHAEPRPLMPGEPFEVTLRLNDIAHRFAGGNVVRLAVSTAYWPLIWPSPRSVTLSLFTAHSRLVLPVRDPRPDDGVTNDISPFEVPASAEPVSEQHALAPTRYVRTLERDLADGTLTYRMFSDGGDLDVGSVVRIEAINLDLGHQIERVFRIQEGDPLSAVTRIEERFTFCRGDWAIRVNGSTTTRSDETDFYLDATLQAHEGEELVFSRVWNERIPRKLV